MRQEQSHLWNEQLQPLYDFYVNDKRDVTVTVKGRDLSLTDVWLVAREKQKVVLDDEAVERIAKAKKVVDKIAMDGTPTYGISTGFGELSTVYIEPDKNESLQRNLILSHACGVGDPFPEDVVRAIMLLRLNTLAVGYSGVSDEVPEILVDMLNKGVTPYVPSKGSLGASGDLANLAHVALVMLGEGEAFYEGKRMKGSEALEAAGIKPVRLNGKDGLALINGTQIMAALGTLSAVESMLLLLQADMGTALTFEAFNGITKALDPRIHQLRAQPGQMAVAENLLSLLEGSSSVDTRPNDVQDPYTLRCVPQVHGATVDAINYVAEVLTREINAVTDNPIVFPETGEVISGGNFHGQPLAITLDFLAIAVAELANISERRTERLVNPQLSGNLPAFLIKESGVNSGFMIPQYTAAALVSENKVLTHPASVDSITSSANKEDHVSMGANAARKLREVIKNTRQVLAIEWMVAAQAIDLREIDKLGRGTADIYAAVREKVDYLAEDRILHYDLIALNDLLNDPKPTLTIHQQYGI
mgnify:CR=1 FL=1